MKAFDLHKNVIENYKNYILSFMSVKDKRIEERIKKAILENEFIPDPLIQFNPSYIEISDLDKFVKDENLHPDIETIGESYHEHRKQLMLKMKLGLTKTYNAFHAPEVQPGITDVALHGKDKKIIEKQFCKEVWNLWNHPQRTSDTYSIEEAIVGIVRLRKLHVEMDNAVLQAYGWDLPSPGGESLSRTEQSEVGRSRVRLMHDFYAVDYLPENDRIRFTIHPDARREVLKRLLELNHKIHEEEVRAGLWDKNKNKDKKTKDKSLSSEDKEEEGASYEQEDEEEQLPAAAEEPPIPAFESGTLFHTPEIDWSRTVKNFKVIIQNRSGYIFKYHVFPAAEKDKYTSDYRQIRPTSPMAEEIIGKNEGDRFEFGGMEYKIVKIEV